jgi:hypothetical protein
MDALFNALFVEMNNLAIFQKSAMAWTIEYRIAA